MVLMSMIRKQGGIKKLAALHYCTSMIFLIKPLSDLDGGEKSFHYYQL
jgi:hypothetical protein